MKKIHIVGRKNNGKTTLVVDIVEELVRQNYRVGTIKHTPHTHELDLPGKDSHRHRTAGANPAAIIAKDMTAVFMPTVEDQNHYEKLSGFYSGCDIVIVEGDIETGDKKVEVWRKDTGSVPIFSEREDILAVITDDEVQADIPVWKRSDVPKLVKNLLELMN